MKKPPDPFHEFVAELFGQLGHVSIRRMFGGAGVYLHGVMFALLANEVVYLKVDDDFRERLVAEGSEPFRFQKKDGTVAEMNYYRLPDAAMDDPDEASMWGRGALDIAMKAKASRPVKNTKGGKRK